MIKGDTNYIKSSCLQKAKINKLVIKVTIKVKLIRTEERENKEREKSLKLICLKGKSLQVLND